MTKQNNNTKKLAQLALQRLDECQELWLEITPQKVASATCAAPHVATSVREIPEMKERLRKGCAVDCSGECGDCTRFGTPIDIRGKLYLIQIEDGTNIANELHAIDANRKYLLLNCDDEGKWKAVADAATAIENTYSFCAVPKGSAEQIRGMIEAELENAQCDIAVNGCFSVAESKMYARLTELKDEENIMLAPTACAAFEGIKYLMAGGANYPAPEDADAIVVVDSATEKLELETWLECYERGKRQ